MMSSSDQPRKKRRVDPQEGSSSCVSPEVLPLVLPNQVPKSSKDPNRGMYPKNDRTKKKRSFSGASFTNASKLLKESAEKDAQNKETVLVNLSPDVVEDGAFSQKSEQLNQSKTKQVFTTSSSELSTKPKRKTSKSKFPTPSSLANKIINYFKPTPESCAKKKAQSKTALNNYDGLINVNNAAGGSGILSNYSHIPGPSGTQSSHRYSKEIFPVQPESFEKKLRYFGLAEETSNDKYDENSPSYFSHLPRHILETILCTLPYLDLVHGRLVCSTWKAVISDPKFMEWKKRYYGLKRGKMEYADYMAAVCKRLEVEAAEHCFENLLKFMSKEFKKKPSTDMYDLLMKNTKGAQADAVLNERFPDLLNKKSKAWCILATAILISETVDDVHGIYKSLLSPKSCCSRHDITDAFYCIATFLLYFKTRFGINHGLHYRVYTTLYWIENELSKNTEGSQTLNIIKGLPGQQSIHSYCEKGSGRLTNEQLRILNHRLKPSQIIKIVALAGTGKTTTLIHFAQLYPQLNFLNIMYNKAVCEEAKKRFPRNVTCRTAHSLAYAVYGNKLRFKLASKVRPHDLVAYIKHHRGSDLSVHSYCKLVLSTIEKFLFSTESEIGLVHIPSTISDINGVRSVDDKDKCRIFKDATLIWGMMIDRENKDPKITHDVYLKLYQLSKPKLVGYDCIMVDEAQDCNLAMLDIVMSQGLPVILVGDPNQQIYGFRGAVNALESFTPTHVYYLTKSFRFGPEIAYVASCCLEVLKSNHTNTIVGTNKPSFVDGKSQGQYAIITRSNIQLFNEVIRICCQERFKPSEPTVIHGCFAGGLKSYNLDQMLDIYKLQSHEEGSELHLSDKFIARFRSFRALKSYARNVEDGDLQAKIDLVQQHNSRIVDYIRIIKEKCSYSMALANIVFSTAHKSKGLEFDTVCVSDDYPVAPSIDFARRNNQITLRLQAYNFNWAVDPEESNIIYVALTRAKNCLILPDRLLRVLLAAQEKFEYPMPPSLVSNGNSKLECIGCLESFVPHTSLILVRRKIVPANGHAIKGGALCTKCATEPTVRPRVQIEPVIMFLDPSADYAHRSMATFVGPLPSDPPIIRDSFGAFHEMDVVYVINLNV